jgi:LacI family transcriptional regulator
MAVTIQQIAEKAGVSKATVSRVLNGRAVKHETQARIKAVMEKMQYRPHRFARGLASQGTGFLGVAVPPLEDPYVAFVLAGIEEEARRHGKLLTLSILPPEEALEMETIRTMTDPPLVEGLLFLLPTPALEGMLKSLAQKGFPLVVASERRYEDWAPSVVIDNFNGAKAATEYLLSKGHKRIGFITGRAALSDSKDRLEGYRQALQDAGVKVEEDLILQGNYELASGKEAGEKFLQMKNPPTAIFASNDLMAIGVQKACQAQGKAGVFSIMGFDDIPTASLVNPALTTMGYDLKELGRQAVHKLLRIISGEEKNPSTLQMKTHLVVRESA